MFIGGPGGALVADSAREETDIMILKTPHPELVTAEAVDLGDLSKTMPQTKKIGIRYSDVLQR